MLSMGFQSGVNNAFTCYSLPCQTPSCKTFKATISINPKPNRIRSSTFFDRNRRHVSRNQRYTAFAVPEAPAAETPADAPPSNAAEESIPIRETEKNGVGGEATGEAKAGVEVCMDGEEHRAGS
ncbi:hypothetical protein OIU85_006032 [Salix viminalis]|uniref:Uncharacterized protein n=1 Tax=Salix viminalis TaxID=40686 RepID=A0A9Q0PKH2_SALVM|nr:hypothetical protein OIU85_006032 [Salix viminalis]